MMDEGNYYGRLVSGALGVANNGSEQMVLTWEITHVAIDGQWADIQPCQRRMYLSFSGGAEPYTRKKLESLGFNGDFENPGFGDDATAKGLTLVCKHNEHKGNTQERWDLAGFGESEIKRATPDVARRRAALWRQQHQARPAQPGRTRPTAAKPAAPPPVDDAPPPEPDSAADAGDPAPF